jgi:hypothetical protein
MHFCSRRDLLAAPLFATSVLILSAGSSGPAQKGAKTPELPPLNKKVLEYAREHLGKKVGNGQCTALADDALKAAGARGSSHREPNADYTWGRRVESFKKVLPGDVLQFRSAVFEGKRALGSGQTLSWRYEYPHHTAIVAEVRDKGRSVILLHQNVGPPGASEEKKQVVQQDTIRADSLKSGSVWIYRPVEVDAPPEAKESSAGGAAGHECCP